MARGRQIAVWTASIILAALFLFAGVFKLVAPAKVGEAFLQYGLPTWFAIVVGVCEALGAIGLLVPRLAGLAAAGLCGIMVGAVVTMATHGQAVQALFPLATLALLVWVAYVRFKEAHTKPPHPLHL